MQLEILRRAGLSNGEIRIYNALLDIGEASTNKIHEKTGIERRNIYDILNKLIERGLITYIEENKRKVYRIVHPKRIIAYLDEKKEKIDMIKEEVIHEMPGILDQISAQKKEVHGETFRGVEGIKSVLGDMLDHKKIHLLGSGEFIAHKIPHFFHHWDLKRARSKIELHHLFISELKGKVPKRPYQHFKFLPEGFSGSPTFVAIYGDKVANFLLGKQLFVFVIESEELAHNYRKYHKFLWKNIAR